MAKKHKRHGRKHRKSTKRSRAAKRAYKKSGLYAYNLKRKRHHKGKKHSRKSKKAYGRKHKKKASRKHRHHHYAMRQAAAVNWGEIARAAQKSKERRAAAEAGFGGPPRAKHADTPYLRALRKKHKARAGRTSGLPAWF